MDITKRKRNKVDDGYHVIAKLFNKTPNYIRLVIMDEKHIKYKGLKPQAIRRAYLKYKYSKERLIQQLEKFKPAA